MYATVRTLFKTSINGNLCRCLNRTVAVSTSSNSSTHFRNYSSYRSSQQYNPEEKINYEVSKNPEEWKYVARLMPYKYIPEPEKKDEYPSGWTMPNRVL